MPEKLPVRSITSNWPILVLITVRLSQVLLLLSPLQLDFLPSFWSLIKIIFLSFDLDHHRFGWWLAIIVDGQWDNWIILPFPIFHAFWPSTWTWSSSVLKCGDALSNHCYAFFSQWKYYFWTAIAVIKSLKNPAQQWLGNVFAFSILLNGETLIATSHLNLKGENGCLLEFHGFNL